VKIQNTEYITFLTAHTMTREIKNPFFNFIKILQLKYASERVLSAIEQSSR